MRSMRDVYIFGYGPYGQEIVSAIKDECLKLTIIDQYQRHLDAAQKDGYTNLVQINVHDDENFQQLVFSRDSLVFCAFEDEGYNTYLTITLRAHYEKLHIVAIGESKESTHKLTMAGANKVIIVEDTGANIIYNTLINPAVTKIFDEILYKQDDLSVAEILITKGSPYDGMLLKDIDLPLKYNIIILGLVDKELDEQFLFATTQYEHKIDHGDTLVIIGPKEELDRCKKELS